MTSQAPPLVHYLSSLVAKLHGHLDGAVIGSNVGDIHQARVATRRLKAALDLFTPVLSEAHGKTLGQGLKKLRRRLGALRDHDVMMGHLRKIRRKRDARALEFLLAELQRSRNERAQKLAGQVNLAKAHARLDEQWEPARLEMIEAEEAVPGLLRDSLLCQVEAFSTRAGAVASGNDEAASEKGVDPHELRIAGKSLRYTLEMVDEAATARVVGKEVMSVFKEMQEHLGAWHDFVVLGENALRTSLEREILLHDAPLARQMLDLAQHLLVRAEGHLADFFALWRERGAEIHDRLHSLFAPTPAATPVTW